QPFPTRRSSDLRNALNAPGKGSDKVPLRSSPPGPKTTAVFAAAESSASGTCEVVAAFGAWLHRLGCAGGTQNRILWFYGLPLTTLQGAVGFNSCAAQQLRALVVLTVKCQRDTSCGLPALHQKDFCHHQAGAFA